MKKAISIFLRLALVISLSLVLALFVGAEDISSYTLEIVGESTFTYDGEDKAFNVRLLDEKGDEVSSDNYEITYLRDDYATIDFKSAGAITVRVDGKGEYSGSKSVVFVINKAVSMGKPTYTEITEGNKTLSDAKLSTNDTFKLKGTLSWMKPDDTIVKYKEEYTWVFTPDDSNYDTFSGKIKLFSECKTHTYSSACDTNCNACGNDDKIPPDHKFMEIKVVQPTKDVEGSKTLECVECGFVKTEIIPIKALKGWHIALIVIGSLLVVILVPVIIVKCLKAKKEKLKRLEKKGKKKKKHWKKKK